MKLEEAKWLLEQYGKAVTYDNFIGFVKVFLAPHMSAPLVEEKFYRKLFNEVWQSRHNCVMLPRGHGKTEILGIWLTIYIAVFQPVNPFLLADRGKKDRIKQQLIIGVDHTQTMEWFDRIKHYFVESPYLQAYSTSGDENRWNAKKIELNNGSVIHARSIKGKIRGLHVDRVHCDDIITEVSTLGDRETENIFYGAIDGTTTAKHGIITVTGTPLRFTDILHNLKGNESYHFKSMPAVIDWEARTVLSPRRRTWDDLMDTKRRIGSTKFQSEYMLNPIDNEMSLIKRSWIEACFDPYFTTQRHRSYFTEVYLGVDFAFSDRATADKSVFCTIGHHEGRWYILDYVVKKGLSGMEQLQFIKELNAIYRYDLIALEENSITAITKEVKELGLPVKLFRTANIDERDKAHPQLTGVMSISKKNFVMRLATMFENKELVIAYKTEEDKTKAAELVAECVSFALEDGKIVEVGVHPDIPIALGYALEIGKSNAFIFDWPSGE